MHFASEMPSYLGLRTAASLPWFAAAAAVDYSKDFTGMTCDPNYCNGVVDTGSIVTLTPTPKEGSVFKSWGGHPDCSKENRPITGNRLCIAYFGKEED